MTAPTTDGSPPSRDSPIPTVVAKSDRGEVQVLDNGFAASLVDGVWYARILFTADELAERFTRVHDPDERDSLLSAARRSLALPDPPPPGEPYQSPIEPIRQLGRALDVSNLDPSLHELRLATRREWARLSLHRYALSFDWVGLLWQSLLEDRLHPYPDAKAVTIQVANALSDLVPH